MKTPETIQPAEEVIQAIEYIPPTVADTLEQQLQTIDEQCREHEAELKKHQERCRQILPELERLKQSVVKAEQTEFRDAVSEQLKKYQGETVKKQLDRVYQTKVKNPKIDYTRSNIAKFEAALWYSNSQVIKYKGIIDTLKKERNNLLAGHHVEKIRQCVKDFGDEFNHLKSVYNKFIDAIYLYRDIESDLPARLRIMGINDVFLTELWAMTGSRELRGKMLDLINNMASRWSIPDNPFISDQQKVTGHREVGRFGLEKAFGNAPVQR